MSLQHEIPELVRANVITQETADRIQAYYGTKKSQSGNRIFTVFGVLGATLVGLGVILIIAHNWDNLSRPIKTVLSFLPLLIGQALCVFTLVRKNGQPEWRESSAVFLFFAVGASISLVAQVYNISGDFDTFLLTWMLLCLPLVYLMKSSVTSLFYLIGITVYACNTGYWNYPPDDSYLFWILFALVLPHFYGLYKKNSDSNFMALHHWLVPLSLVITLGIVAKIYEEFMFVAYLSLFGLFYLIGNLDFFSRKRAAENAYLIIGSLGTIALLFMLGFKWFWEDLERKTYFIGTVIASPEFLVSFLLAVLASILFYRHRKNKPFSEMKPIEPVFLLFIPTMAIGFFSWITATILVNVLVLAIGILTIRDGEKRNHLGILNYGLLIVTILVICRFFDTNLSFIIRGILFMLVGGGFFLANYRMLKKRKQHEQ